jgi:hypothetical protein
MFTGSVQTQSYRYCAEVAKSLVGAAGNKIDQSAVRNCFEKASAEAFDRDATSGSLESFVAFLRGLSKEFESLSASLSLAENQEKGGVYATYLILRLVKHTCLRLGLL